LIFDMAIAHFPVLFLPRASHRICAGVLAICLSLVATIWPAPVAPGPFADPAQACLVAAHQAARAHGVPEQVLLAIALVETGRKRGGQMQPWPWAVHARGQGHWAATREDALALIRTALAEGHRNIDMGCFQVNFHWHGQNFASLEQMIDPQVNADYAAHLLRGHFDRLGAWDLAAGAYHSGTPDLAARYRARFMAMLESGPDPVQVASLPQAHDPLPRPVRHNRFPLLVAPEGAGGSGGSLVPLAAIDRADTARPLIGF
jgi:hypothetical protein